MCVHWKKRHRGLSSTDRSLRMTLIFLKCTFISRLVYLVGNEKSRIKSRFFLLGGAYFWHLLIVACQTRVENKGA